MKSVFKWGLWSLRIILGSCMFALGFDLFLSPHHFNGGGMSGLAQIVSVLTGFGSVAFWVAAFNVPLFIVAGRKLGKKFFVGSLIGIVSVTVALELFTYLPAPTTEPLLACIYGGVLIGGGLGLVFTVGASTGGSDIVVRLIKRKWRNLPIGTITMGFDICVMLLTGLAFGDLSKSLYTGVTVFLSGKVLDLVVYSFDYSKVTLIISDKHQELAEAIFRKLGRGATFLSGEGSFTHRDKKVILTAIKRHQLADLKELVTNIDPDAFVIVQEAHQVLGDGFARYTKDSL